VPKDSLVPLVTLWESLEDSDEEKEPDTLFVFETPWLTELLAPTLSDNPVECPNDADSEKETPAFCVNPTDSDVFIPIFVLLELELLGFQIPSTLNPCVEDSDDDAPMLDPILADSERDTPSLYPEDAEYDSDTESDLLTP